MIHNLQVYRSGLFNFSPLKHPPLWKLEGYPEYIARQSKLMSENYSLKSEVQRYEALSSASDNGMVEVTEGHFMPVHYYKGRLMIEYLMDTRGMTYDAILKDNRYEEMTYQELLQWVKTSAKVITSESYIIGRKLCRVYTWKANPKQL